MTEHFSADVGTSTGARQSTHPAPTADWDPRSADVAQDATPAYDRMRSRCPVAMAPDGSWTVFRHADVVATVTDDETFSNATSRFRQVPNGLDGDEHTAFRAVVDRYFTPERMAEFAPVVTEVARTTVAELVATGRIEAVAAGARFAVRAQSAWLGWPVTVEEELLDWVSDNRAATRSGDSGRTAAVAERFDRIILRLTGERRAAGDAAPDDITTELTRERIQGRPLADPDIVSILRNWTGGDLGSMALAAGVVLAHLADHPERQDLLRGGLPDPQFDAVIDEILRMDDPFVSNRRVATRDVQVGGRPIPAGARVVVNWTAANRDPLVFGSPDTFDPVAHAADNLVYGRGRHVCPGRPLAALELRVVTRALLAATTAIVPDPDRPRERERPPAGGWATVPLLLR